MDRKPERGDEETLEILQELAALARRRGLLQTETTLNEICAFFTSARPRGISTPSLLDETFPSKDQLPI